MVIPASVYKGVVTYLMLLAKMSLWLFQYQILIPQTDADAFQLQHVWQCYTYLHHESQIKDII